MHVAAVINRPEDNVIGFIIGEVYFAGKVLV